MKKRKKTINNKYYVGRSCSYGDVEFDSDGWADATIYFPFNFDLIAMRTKKSEVNGWWDGAKWIGFRLSPKDEVKYWKRIGH